MMKNSEVAKDFAFGLESRAGNFFSTGDKAFSYDTIIAQRIDGVVYINNTYYSNTTSRHRGLIRRAFDSDQKIITLEDIPIGTHDLRPYIK